MSMEVVPQKLARRNALLSCVVAAFAVVASFLFGQITGPSVSKGKVLLFARVLPIAPNSSYAYAVLPILKMMQRNDAHLDKFAGKGLFKAAFDCGIKSYLWESLPVNHWPSYSEVLVIPINSLTEDQSRCVSRLIVPPNVATAIVSEDDQTRAVQRMTSRDPFSDWY